MKLSSGQKVIYTFLLLCVIAGMMAGIYFVVKKTGNNTIQDLSLGNTSRTDAKMILSNLLDNRRQTSNETWLQQCSDVEGLTSCFADKLLNYIGFGRSQQLLKQNTLVFQNETEQNIYLDAIKTCHQEFCVDSPQIM